VKLSFNEILLDLNIFPFQTGFSVPQYIQHKFMI